MLPAVPDLGWAFKIVEDLSCFCSSSWNVGVGIWATVDRSENTQLYPYLIKC